LSPIVDKLEHSKGLVARLVFYRVRC